VVNGVATNNTFMLTYVLASGGTTTFGSIAANGKDPFYNAGAVATTFVVLQILFSFFTFFMVSSGNKSVALVSAMGGLLCSIIAWTVYAGLVGGPYTGGVSGVASSNLSAGFAFQIIYTILAVILLFLISTMTVDDKAQAPAPQGTVVVAAPVVVSAAVPPPPMVVAAPMAVAAPVAAAVAAPAPSVVEDKPAEAV
jgi:hypothetical protein